MSRFHRNPPHFLGEIVTQTPEEHFFKDTVTFLGGSATRKNKQQPEDRKGDTLNSCKRQTYRAPSTSLRPQFDGFLTEPKAALACFKLQLLSTPSNGRLALGGGNFCGPQRFWPQYPSLYIYIIGSVRHGKMLPKNSYLISLIISNPFPLILNNYTPRNLVWCWIPTAWFMCSWSTSMSPAVKYRPAYTTSTAVSA